MHRLLEQQLAQSAYKTAFVFNDKAYSYQWLDDYAKAMAEFLHNEGYKSFAFCTWNSPFNVVAYLAASISGCHCLAINPRYTSFELSNILSEFKPDIFFIEADRITAELEITAQQYETRIYSIDVHDPMQSKLWHTFDQYLRSGRKFSANPNETFIYHLTSGAMGHSKYCQHSAQQIYDYGLNRAQDMGFELTDLLLTHLSFNHAFAFSYQLLPALALGLTTHLQTGFDEKSLFDTIVSEGVTSIAMLPSMAYFLSIYANDQQPFQHKLRYPLVAGDALPSVFRKKFKDVFSVDLYQGVGMTEVFGYAQNTPGQDNALSSGKLFDTVKIQIRGEQGELLAPCETGDVFLQNEATLSSYYLQPELTQKELADGWVNTGDVGYLDEDNFFYFLGRKKQIIIRGGSNISPVEVESALYQHPHVLQAAVVGKKDKIWGQVVWAYVVPDEDFTGNVDELYQLCRKYLSAYKQPEHIIVVEALPKNATGKIDRYQLQVLANATEKRVSTASSSVMTGSP